MLTSELLTPIVDAVQSNLTLIVPVAIGLFATMFGIRLVPKIIKNFAK